MKLIGGHSNPEGRIGLKVFRDVDSDGRRVVIKKAHTGPDREGIAREAACLIRLEGSRFAPNLYRQSLDEIVQEDLGDSELANDGERFRQEGIRLLWDLRKAEIRHGDLSYVNVVIKNDAPIAIDFQQSNFFSEPAPQEDPLSDSYNFWRWVCKEISDSPRVIRRWLAVIEELGGLDPHNPLVGKTLLDLGCFQGDFVAMAAADGMMATGVDNGGFRQGENSVVIGRELFGHMAPNFELYQANVALWTNFEYDVVMMFSTWAYYVIDYGLDQAHDLLRRIMAQCGVLFFETQLAGDGPGPQHLVSDDDVGNMLGQWGIPKPLATIPVTGGAAERTVWAVQKS